MPINFSEIKERFKMMREIALGPKNQNKLHPLHEALRDHYREKPIPATFTVKVGNKEYTSATPPRDLSMRGRVDYRVVPGKEHHRIVYTLPEKATEALAVENQIVMLATPSVLSVQGPLRQVAETIKDKTNTVMAIQGDTRPIRVPFVYPSFAELVTDGAKYLPKGQPVSEELLTTSHRDIALFRRQGNNIHWYSDDRNKPDSGVIPYVPGEPIQFDTDELFFKSIYPQFDHAREVAQDIAQRDTVVRILTPGSAERQQQDHFSVLQQQASQTQGV